jgi:hypothetical protein
LALAVSRSKRPKHMIYCDISRESDPFRVDRPPGHL